MGAFRYMRPDELMTRTATVSGVLDSGYQASWLCDLRPGFPIRGTASGALAMTISSGTSTLCDLLVASHLRIDAAIDITIASGLTATLDSRGVGADGIPANRWEQITPATSTGCTFSVTGNSQAVICGEFFAGKSRTLTRRLRSGATRTTTRFSIPANAEFSSVLGYNKGLFSLTLSGDQYFISESEITDIENWYRACADGTLPTPIIPDDSKDICHIVKFLGYEVTEGDATLNVAFTFEPFPVTTW
jgi:hypothetical protein